MSKKPSYKGRGMVFLQNVFLYLLVTAPLFSFCLMGMQWFYIFSAMSVLALPVVLLGGLLVSRMGFSFDDDQQQIARSFGRSVPYASITRVDLNETGRLLSVSAKQGRWRSTALSYALDSKEKSRLKGDLFKRFPVSTVRERRYVDWKSLAIIVSVVMLLTAGFHVYLYQNREAIRIVPIAMVWEGPNRALKDARQYQVGDINIVVPGRFMLTGVGENVLQFEDREEKTEVKFVGGDSRPNPLGSPSGRIVRYATGIRDNLDLFKTAYAARVGVIPLVMKDMLLTGLTDVVVYDIRLTAHLLRADYKKSAKLESAPRIFNGFLTRGKKKERETASLVLREAGHGAEFYAFLSGPKRMDEKNLQRTMAGVFLTAGR